MVIYFFPFYRTFQTCARVSRFSPAFVTTCHTISTSNSRELSGFFATLIVPSTDEPARAENQERHWRVSFCKQRMQTQGGEGKMERSRAVGNEPISTSKGSLSKKAVCFQCVGVSHAPVVKKISPSASRTLSFRSDESASRADAVK